MTRKNPKTGLTETPHRDRQGNFVLGDPAFGSELHHRKNAVLTSDYREAVRLVRRGFSIRMSASDDGPPTMISARKLTFTEVDDVLADDIVYEGPKTPFSRGDVMKDLQKALIAEAAMIFRWGSRDAAEAFIGLSLSRQARAPLDDGDPTQIDLSRFQSTAIIDAAFDWAFQTNQPGAFRIVDRDNLCSLLEGASSGTPRLRSPMADSVSPLRMTIDTALARWKLEFEPDKKLAVRELALLAQMTEVAARNALAKAGLKARGGIDNHSASRWLSERQKFIPTRAEVLATT